MSFWKGEFTLKERIACNRIKLHVCVKTNNVMSLDCLIYHLSFGKTKGANYSPSVLRQVNFAIEVCSIKQGVIYFPLIKAVMSQFKFQFAIEKCLSLNSGPHNCLRKIAVKRKELAFIVQA